MHIYIIYNHIYYLFLLHNFIIKYITDPITKPPKPNTIFFKSDCDNNHKLTIVAITGITGPNGIINPLSILGAFFLITGTDKQVGIYCANLETTLIEANVVKLPVNVTNAVNKTDIITAI